MKSRKHDYLCSGACEHASHSEPQYTPGPWILDSRWPKAVVSEFANKGPLSLEVVAMNVKPENARLIASAPELLEALKKTQKLIHDSVECDLECCDECTDALVAIAKAEGK